jgi:hypothetical protein
LRQVVNDRAENGALVPLSVVTGLEDPHLAAEVDATAPRAKEAGASLGRLSLFVSSRRLVRVG